MRIVLFYHSLVSCWNHGNAHFLRGVASELLARGHELTIYEPANGWSVSHLTHDHGRKPIRAFHEAYPRLRSTSYDLASFDPDKALRGAELVIVHEWNPPELVRMIGEHRARQGSYRLLFHDTHHRSVSNPREMEQYDLSNYDGALAFGEKVRQRYLSEGWADRAWTWHEAADTRVFRPLPALEKQWDLVWVGNWGDEERTAELEEFLIRPVAELGLRACVFGVRYPPQARWELERAGIEYGGWLPNFQVPRAFAHARLTVHIPRRPYVRTLPGIPTIRPFEALSCATPLICSPWQDSEELFTVGEDYVSARGGWRMKEQIRMLLNDNHRARHLAKHGRKTILARHTCGHRVDQLMQICEQLGLKTAAPTTRPRGIL